MYLFHELEEGHRDCCAYISVCFSITCNTMTLAKCKSVSIEEKIIIQRLEAGESNATLAKNSGFQLYPL